jgi:S-methylmethionine-dependent homocysteine/selenocysteine methylase
MLQLTDGGMETTLIFREGIDLPEFAAFTLLASERGQAALRRYFDPYVELAGRLGVPLVLDAPTWRANVDWGEKLGLSPEEVDQASRDGVALLVELRTDAAGEPPVIICGCIGPRGDSYDGTATMSVADAEAYHSRQVRVFAETDADLVSGMTLPTVVEAVGIARAAVAAEMPVVISFTVETDGRLPSGQALGEAIDEVDAETDGAPRYFMVNCAHPTHFEQALAEGGDWRGRIHGVRANASNQSHADLDELGLLDAGDPEELAAAYVTLKPYLPNLEVLGGCCGTDHRHIAAIAEAWLADGGSAGASDLTG